MTQTISCRIIHHWNYSLPIPTSSCPAACFC